MKQKVDMEFLYKCAQNTSEEDLLHFDEIFYGVSEGKYVFLLEDIINLCRLQIQGFPYMEPHQECKITEMVFLTVNEVGLKKGFQELIKGLIEISPKKLFLIKMYIIMLLNSYSEDQITIFCEVLSECTDEAKEMIIETIENLIESQPDRYKKKGLYIISSL